MPTRLIAALSALGLLATGGAVVGTASVISTTTQSQQLASQTEELNDLEAQLQQLKEQTPDDGANGIDGQPGAMGPAGDPGPTGPQGTKGISGPRGEDGSPGIDGVDGTDGLPGANGVDGVDGADGLNGLNGADGLDGANGADGRDASRQVQAFYWGGQTPLEGVAIQDFTPTLAPLHQGLVDPPTIVSNGDRLVWLSGDTTKPLSFSVEQSGLYLVHYSIDSANLPPAVPLTIYGYASSSATMGLPVAVPGSRSLLTAGNASASFYVYLEQDATILFVGRSGAVNVTGFLYYPNVSFQLIERGPCTRPICAVG